jgi:hypothetical protein
MLYLCGNKKGKNMATVKTNIWNLKVGDRITFTNYLGSKRESIVTRVTDNSWYSPNRQSWGTLADYEKTFADFKIIRNEN